MNRLMEKMVCLGLVTAWRLATWPTRRLPSLVKATTEGVVRPPSELGITVGSPPSMTATTEFVVSRSIPIILLLILLFSPKSGFGLGISLDQNRPSPSLHRHQYTHLSPVRLNAGLI